MSFNVKYDRDGNVIKESQPEIVELAQEEVVQEQPSTIQAQEQQPEVIESSDSSVAEEVIEQQPIKKTPSESFKELKEAKMREERERIRVQQERDELARRLAEMEQSHQRPKTVEQEEDYSINVNPDDLVEGKHLSKVDKKIKQLEAKLAQYEQKNTALNIETRIKSQYPDFDRIVTKENVDMLKAQYPEIAQTLNASNDLYSTAVSAYTLIKKFGITPDEQTYKPDLERAQRNAIKPKPTAAVSPQYGESPLAKANAFANGLTEDLRKQLYREMQDAKKNM